MKCPKHTTGGGPCYCRAESIVDQVLGEVERAKRKYPTWPTETAELGIASGAAPLTKHANLQQETKNEREIRKR